VKCPQCQSLNPDGAPRCSLCGRALPERAASTRQASSYFGVHTVVGEDGRPIRALLDLGPSPLPNLLVGVGICLLFALSALPTIISQSGRVAASVRFVEPTWEDEGLIVRMLVLADDEQPIAVDGEVRLTVWLRDATAPGTGGSLVATVTRPLHRQDFLPQVLVVRHPSSGTAILTSSAQLARIGPLTSEDLGGLTRDQLSAGELGVRVELIPLGGTALTATSPWIRLEPER
jgi:hypothetical protein